MKLEEFLMKREEIPVYSYISSYTKSEEHGVIIPIPAVIIENFEKQDVNTCKEAKESLDEVMKKENLIEAFSWELDRRIDFENRIYNTYLKLKRKNIMSLQDMNKEIFNYNPAINSREFFDGKWGDLMYCTHRFWEFESKMVKFKLSPKKVLDENIKTFRAMKENFADITAKRLSDMYFIDHYEPRITGNEAGLCHITIDGSQGTALCIDNTSGIYEFNIKEEKLKIYYPAYDKHQYYPHNIDCLWQAVIGREWGIKYINKLLEIACAKQ